MNCTGFNHRSIRKISQEYRDRKRLCANLPKIFSYLVATLSQHTSVLDQIKNNLSLILVSFLAFSATHR